MLELWSNFFFNLWKNPCGNCVYILRLPKFSRYSRFLSLWYSYTYIHLHPKFKHFIKLFNFPLSHDKNYLDQWIFHVFDMIFLFFCIFNFLYFSVRKADKVLFWLVFTPYWIIQIDFKQDFTLWKKGKEAFNRKMTWCFESTM